jgi:hypothetical protein
VLYYNQKEGNKPLSVSHLLTGLTVEKALGDRQPSKSGGVKKFFLTKNFLIFFKKPLDNGGLMWYNRSDALDPRGEKFF